MKLILFYFSIMLILSPTFFSCNNRIRRTKKATSTKIPFPQQEQNTAIKNIAKIIGPWAEGRTKVTFRFKDNYVFDYRTFFDENKKAFALGKSEMRLKKARNGTKGMTYTYNQFYKDIRVVDGYYVVNFSGDKPLLAFGTIIEDLSLKIKPRLSEEQALALVKAKIKPVKFCWEREEEVTNCAKKGTLRIFKNLSDEYTLHYEFVLKTDEEYPISYHAKIDANTGKITMLKEKDVTI